MVVAPLPVADAPGSPAGRPRAGGRLGMSLMRPGTNTILLEVSRERNTFLARLPRKPVVAEVWRERESVHFVDPLAAPACQ